MTRQRRYPTRAMLIMLGLIVLCAATTLAVYLLVALGFLSGLDMLR